MKGKRLHTVIMMQTKNREMKLFLCLLLFFGGIAGYKMRLSKEEATCSAEPASTSVRRAEPVSC